jgi:large repetitive protein
MKNLPLLLSSFREAFQVGVILLLAISPIHAQRQWDEVGVMPYKVALLNAETVGDTIYVMGGLVSIPLASDAVYAFNPADNTFTGRQSIPEKLGASASAVLNDKIYLFGGVKSSLGQTTPHCYVYNPAIDQWSSLTDMSVSRAYAVAEVVDGKIYVIGGIGPGGAPLLNLVEEYDPANNTWSIKTPMDTYRGYMSSEVLDNKIFVMGGLRWPENISLDEVEIYDPATDMWSNGDDLPTPRLGLAAGLLENTIYTVAGFDTNPYQDVALVEGFTEGIGWTSYDDLPYPIHGLAVATFKDSLYLLVVCIRAIQCQKMKYMFFIPLASDCPIILKKRLYWDNLFRILLAKKLPLV